MIQERGDALGHSATLWSEMEFVFGKAQFGRDFDCIEPTFSEGRLRLIGARHPLLEDNLRRGPDQPVPCSLEMDAESRVLVISGPNAGGKTVLLKTPGPVDVDGASRESPYPPRVRRCRSWTAFWPTSATSNPS